MIWFPIVILAVALALRAFYFSPRQHGENSPQFVRDIKPALRLFGVLIVVIAMSNLIFEHVIHR